jgi:aminoglycoside N3'-acetyltransferase
MNQTYVPYQEIVNQFDLKEDDVLLISSDIAKLAYTSIKNKERFDPVLLVKSFRDKLVNGTLIFPTFIEHFKAGDTFDKFKSAPEMGVLSTLAFQNVDYMRSSDPIHSFSCVGHYADDIFEIKSDSTFGSDSVFAFLKEKRAKMLLIDVDLQHSFTFAHHVEELMQVKYRKYIDLQYYSINESGKKVTDKVRVFSKKNGVVNTLNNLEQLFIERGAMGKIEINGSVFRLIHLDTAFEIMKEDIENNGGKSMYSFDFKQYIRSTIKSVIGK